MKAVAITVTPGRDTGSVRRGRRPSLLSRIAMWRRVARERRRLLHLDPRLLADMGLTPEAVHREAMRPFWDIDAER